MSKNQPDKDTKARKYFSKVQASPPELNLIKLQLDSYSWFLAEGIREVLDEISPVEDFTGKNWTLELGSFSFGKSKYNSEQAKLKGVTFDAPLKIEAILINKQSGQRYKQEVFLGDIPQMTEKGTFIINGVERVIINQLVRSPGAFFSAADDPITGRRLYSAEIRPYRGSWLEFNISRGGVITAKIDRRRKFAVTTLLRALGFSESEAIIDIFKDVDTGEDKLIELTLAKDPATTQEEALIEIFRKMRPGDPVVLENAKALLEGMFFNTRRYNLTKVGRFKINKRLSLDIPHIEENWILTKEDIIATLKYLIKLNSGEGKVDDIDHLANRRVRCAGELVQQNAFRIGVLRLERIIKERMSLAAADQEVTPGGLINAKPVIAAINEFFRSSQLSSILDQVNPLSELDHLRRLSVMGTGGITRDRASFSVRDINHSQYGRIDPIRSPEGQNIGLVTYLALYARINEYGFLETPYRRVILQKGRPRLTNEIVYLTADDEEEQHITEATVTIDDKGFILDERVPTRHLGSFFEGPAKDISLIDISPQQIFGTSASLIPFLAHDDANRALMGTQMQCQAVPLLKPSAPIVGTGMEQVVAENMGRMVRASDDGTVTYVDGKKLIFKTRKDELTFEIKKFVHSPQGTSYSQKPLVSPGQRVKRGELLIDGAACENGELALGQNLLIAYMSFDGLGYEDAIVISDRLVKEDTLSSIHIEEYEIDVVETKLGPEELTRDIPNVSEEALANLDDQGIVRIGAEVGPNDILVGKVQPKGETELTAEERLLRAIFGEKAKEVRDTSLRIPHGERGTVIGVQILSRDEGDELDTGTLMRIKVKVAQLRKVTEGDKLAGRHGNKGVISKIIPGSDMPHLEDGTPIDIIISPLSVLSRMNLGQLMETHWGFAADKLGYQIAAPVFEKLDEEKLIEELKKAGLPYEGKVKLIDGRSGEPFDNTIMVGKNYILKLIHMVEEKIHARSTGPYSLVTQQPLGGKAQMGGQRLGEMEVWALEAYGAAHILQEMLTIKSDDVVGRAKAFEAIVKGIDIPQALIPESFKVLVKELQALGLSVETLGAKIVSAPEVEEKPQVAAQVAQMEQVLQAEATATEGELKAEESPFEIVDSDKIGVDSSVDMEKEQT
ncbi:DNA-directed RNA polymerase subunit beta [Candidatus Microgenomates bacterium]|nr:DNA-directed RNA polymerase subunit beta [Candidatus Microgenomates bacterium]